MNGTNDDGGFRFGSGLGHADGQGGRRRLVALLREIAELAGERSLKRCPYRAARDACTFRGECGNRYRATGGKALCTGGPLNARRASAEEVAAALEDAGAAFGRVPEAMAREEMIGQADE